MYKHELTISAESAPAGVDAGLARPEAVAQPIPFTQARVPITIRVATLADLPFIDSLHKKYGRALGYWPTKQFEEYIAGGFVLISEHGGQSLGYLISKDRYLKRDELGVIYQLCVVPTAQRGLIGASLLREAFARSAYGCRLYCCWCAQDLKANEFWEAMGFVPVAFRTGSTSKKNNGGRVHIFWQKKIVQDDVETKWWYPFQTNCGAIRADRVVFPIPAGVNWRDVLPIDVPVVDEPKLLDVPRASRPRLTREKKDAGETPAARNGPGPGKVGILVGGRIKYVTRPGYVAPPEPCAAVGTFSAKGTREEGQTETGEEIAREDWPGFLQKVRELRDRYLEHVNTKDNVLALPAKYDVLKTLPSPADIPTPAPTKRRRLAA